MLKTLFSHFSHPNAAAIVQSAKLIAANIVKDSNSHAVYSQQQLQEYFLNHYHLYCVEDEDFDQHMKKLISLVRKELYVSYPGVYLVQLKSVQQEPNYLFIRGAL